MKSWSFAKWNAVLGWVIFVIAFITYLSTIEHYFSFWDTGEYISSAVKLEVTHAPGAALFQLIGAVAALFAFGNESNYGLVINALSSLFSAFTILFLFWTITHLVRKILRKKIHELTQNDQLIILFSGIIGSLSFTFSDTFWYSAVEGEVYAMASMFIALLVWLITKWEDEYRSKGNERWLILIFFVTGMSVGVHMMVMLALPTICLIYYTQNYTFSWKSFLVANLVTLGILSIVFKGIFPFIMTLFGKSEIFFVNGFGLPFHSGTAIAFIILIFLNILLIRYTRKIKKNIYQTISLCIVYMIIGFSCWLMIPIRANANPPMNLNNPDTAIGMLEYYNREQYGDWPTLYGHNYTVHLDYNGIKKNDDGSYKTKKTGDIYEKNNTTGKYEKIDEKITYVYNKDHISILPRMYNQDRNVMSNYISMYGAPDFEFNYTNENIVDNKDAKKIFEQLKQKYKDGTIELDDYLQVKNYNLIKVIKPSLLQNLDYFINFQNWYYFIRYLLWNFVGRQNDLEGRMENSNGNWISGISFIDNMHLGNQENVPAKFKNDSTVYFYFLPFILGLIGLYFHSRRDFGRFYAILSLFILTSVGIIFYTGVKPFEPRERDYAMVGSFYAFAIWIGIGVTAIYKWINTKIKSINWGLGIILLAIPAMMAFQNYTPHNRSGRSTAYDFAYSSLKCLNKDAILFVYGDNDTYPVWAIQETEKFRDDVKVVNFSLLSTPWNIDQVKRKTYNSMPIPSSLTREEYREGTNEQIYLLDKEHWENIYKNMREQEIPETELASFQKYLSQESMTVQEAIQFLRTSSEEKNTVLKILFGENSNYHKLNFLPVRQFILPVNKENAIRYGIIKPHEISLSEEAIIINYEKSSMFKNDLMLLDILANFDWKRTINFSSGGIYDSANIFYLRDYLQFEGFSYKLVPIKTPEKNDGEIGRINAIEMYNTIKTFRWGNFKDLSVHFDETCTQNIINYRSSASRTAEALVEAGQTEKAVEILDLASKEIPVEKYNDTHSLSSMVYGYIISGQEQKGLQLAEKIKKTIFTEYDYYSGLSLREQGFLKRQINLQPMLYSLTVSSVIKGYEKINNKDKAYTYLVESIVPIDKRFDNFIENLRETGKEKSYKEVEKVKKITPFYQYLFELIKPYDSSYESEKTLQITSKIIKAT